MKRQISMAVCITLGSLALYCGQNMAVSLSPDGGAGGGEGGMIKDAHADTACCVPAAPVFTKLWEGDVTDTQKSAEIAVANYRQVIVYLVSSDCNIGATLIPTFRPNAATPYGTTGQYLTAYTSSGSGNVSGGRWTVDGTSMQIGMNTFCGRSYKAHLVVSGVQ